MLTGLETRFFCCGSLSSPTSSPLAEAPGLEMMYMAWRRMGTQGLLSSPPAFRVVPFSFKDNFRESLESERKTFSLPLSYHNL